MLQLNAIFRTNYGTGPYAATELHGPCTCGFDDRRPGQSEAHYHVLAQLVDEATGQLIPMDTKNKGLILAGYRLDGTNVWTRATLSFHGMASTAAPAPAPVEEVPPGTNLSLF